MLYEFKGVCQSCAAELTIRIHNDELLENCSECKEAPFNLKRYKGLVYIVSNPNQAGLKIGMTETSLESRLKGLNKATGVAGQFEPIVIFPSDRPRADEKKVHAKLAKHNLSKEHFDLNAVDAALGAYRALNKREPVFYNKDVEDRFWLELAEAKIKMQLRLKGKTNL